MTERLYYHDSFLYEFDATIVDVLPASSESGPYVLLDRTAFFPTSGGQVFDTGMLEICGTGAERRRVLEVADVDGDRILHFIDDISGLTTGSLVRGFVDQGR